MNHQLHFVLPHSLPLYAVLLEKVWKVFYIDHLQKWPCWQKQKYKLVWGKSLTYLILVNDLMHHILLCKPVMSNHQAYMCDVDADWWWIKKRNIATAKFPDTQTFTIHSASICSSFAGPCTEYMAYFVKYIAH